MTIPEPSQTSKPTLIITALTGPPDEIAEELKDLFMQLNLRRYLERRGVQLAEEQLQLLAC